MLLGAHMSVSGGLSTAFDRAQSIGINTMQIFTKNQNRWEQKPADAGGDRRTGSRRRQADGHRPGSVSRGLPDQPGHARRRTVGKGRSRRWPTN